MISGRVPQPCSSWPIFTRSGLPARCSIELGAILRPRFDVERPAMPARARHGAARRENPRTDDGAGRAFSRSAKMNDP